MSALTEDPSWLPARILLRNDAAHTVHWQHMDDVRFTHPFFRETMAVATGPRVETGLEELERTARHLTARAPDGFIFHLSRCGSTLLTQMLAAMPRHLVLSEPSPVNDVLWPEEERVRPDEHRRAALLENVLRVLTRSREPDGAAFVKCDAWHLLDLPLIRRVFPRVPLVFVYRDPLEIAVSHQRQRGKHMIPGQLDEARLGVPFPPMTATGLDALATQVLARFMEAALTNLPAEALFVHYRELPAPGLARALRHFRHEPSSEEYAAMLATAAFHAKRPGLIFAPDSAARQAAASPELRAIVARHATELYAQLESRRATQD